MDHNKAENRYNLYRYESPFIFSVTKPNRERMESARFLDDLEQPLGSEDVRLQIKAMSICGSDVHYLKHMRNSRIALKEPMVLGHESASIVIQT
ncbi:hypothetical protein KI387_026946, partial [Taxus chinensis]